MKFGLMTLAYNEERLIPKFLSHIPDWVDEIVVLVSTQPWQGEAEPQDRTADLARQTRATVVESYWPNEELQRNTGQSLLGDCDWVIVLDPDEFLDNEGWDNLRKWAETLTGEAGVVSHQRVFWKHKEVSPHTDYQQVIIVKPDVQFVENRVIDRPFVVVPVELYHFSWSRTDEEVWSKISHYSHANEMDIKKWYEEVWLADRQTDLHPKSPVTLRALIPAKLPPELERLNLWPK